MRKAVWIFSLLILWAQVFAAAPTADQNEFAGIPFGTPRQMVIEEILKMGYEPYGMSESSDRIVIPVFMMGELPVQVDFLFNKNDKFYSFEIRTGRVEEARIDKVFEAANYMGEQFNLKYGEAGRKPSLKDSELHRGTNLYQEWFSVRVLNVSTAIVSKDGRFYTIGSVVHRTLAKEQVAEQKSTHSDTAKKAAF